MSRRGGPFGKDTQKWLEFVEEYLTGDDSKKEGSGYSSRENIRNRLINDRLDQIKMRRLQESQMSAVEMEGGVLTDQQFRQAQRIAQQLQVNIERLRERIDQEWDRPDEELNQDLINELSDRLEDHFSRISPILRAIREYEDMFHAMDTSEE
jgi:hypothetical protein